MHFFKIKVFIGMNKTKNLRIRVTERQMRRLLDQLVMEQQEEKSKSSLVRRIIDNYLDHPSDIKKKNKTLKG